MAHRAALAAAALALALAAGVARADAPAATQIAVGHTHACARMSDGKARCWGGNDWGQTDAATLADVVHIGVGYGFTCALLRDRTVRCFGYDGQGQLGFASAQDDVRVPTPVPGVSDAIALATGMEHSCVVRAGGTVACWGRNDDRSLGDGSAGPHVGVVEVTGLDRVTAIAVGSFTCARRDDASVWCWGPNHGPSPRRLAVPSPVAEVAVGDLQGCLRTTDGAVRCWGSNDSGQLGRGDGGDLAPIAGVAGATAVATSQTHACAIADKKLLCWGAEQANPSFPKSCLRDTHHTGGGGAPVQWRYCPVPTPVAGVEDPTAIGVGPNGACAATRAGRLLCWDGTPPKVRAIVAEDDWPGEPPPVQAVAAAPARFPLGDDIYGADLTARGWLGVRFGSTQPLTIDLVGEGRRPWIARSPGTPYVVTGDDRVFIRYDPEAARPPGHTVMNRLDRGRIAPMPGVPSFEWAFSSGRRTLGVGNDPGKFVAVGRWQLVLVDRTRGRRIASGESHDVAVGAVRLGEEVVVAVRRNGEPADGALTAAVHAVSLCVARAGRKAANTRTHGAEDRKKFAGDEKDALAVLGRPTASRTSARTCPGCGCAHPRRDRRSSRARRRGCATRSPRRRA